MPALLPVPAPRLPMDGPPVPADIAAAHAALIGDGVDDDVTAVVTAWLLAQRSPHTRRAYTRDARRWLAWCATTARLHPWQVRRPIADAYASTLPGAPATVARTLAALSSLYAYAADMEVVAANPFARVTRPRLDADHSETTGLTEQEIAKLVTTAHGDSARSYTIVVLLYALGLRVSELLNADVEDLGSSQGHRTLTVTRKGGKRTRLPLPPLLGDALDRYLDGRTTGPLVTTRTGRRLDQPAVFRLLRRLAGRAGVPVTISPHSMRHSVATHRLAAGDPLHRVQDFLGHADPRTTRRYDRGRGRLDHSPAYAAASDLADRLDFRDDDQD